MNPLSIFWILIILCAIAWKLKWRKVSRYAGIGAFLFFFLFSASPLPVWMIRNLEQQYPVYSPAATGKNINILVLGAGNTNDSTLTELHRLSNTASGRLTEGVRLYNILKGSRMVFSGWSSKPDRLAQAELAARAAVSLGVNPTDTLMLIKPTTTWEEAVAYKKRFGSKEPFLLVTSAWHMPRAMETFRRKGLNPIPAPADFLVKISPDQSLYNFWPSEGKLKFTQIAAHEYFGMLYYEWFK